MQQPLERYGVVVLLFLVALVAVAVFWEDGSQGEAPSNTLAAVTKPVVERPAAPAPAKRVEAAPNATAGPAAGGAPALSRGGESGQDQRGRSPMNQTTARVPIGPEGGSSVAPPADNGGFSEVQVRGGHDPMANNVGAGAQPGREGFNGGNSDSMPAELERARRDTEAVAARRGAEAEERARAERREESQREPGSLITPAVHETPKKAAVPAASTDYVVKSGESLSKIAERELGESRRWTEIAALNGIADARTLKAGAKLRMPAKDLPAAGAKPVGTTKEKRGTGDTTVRLASAPGARPYVVRSGDSLEAIARREVGGQDLRATIASIKALNSLSGDTIFAGATLLVPEGAGATRGTAVAALTPEPDAKPARRPRGEFYVR
ncbi:MAG: LysM peptidoglycan-binding domain-containing protein [Planctomycetota bacterium]